MTKRTDIHRPEVLVTEDYEYVLAGDAQAPFGWINDVELIGYSSTGAPIVHTTPNPYRLEIAHKIAASTMGNRSVWQCHHCGAHIRYFAVLKHTSGDYVVVGETCLENRFERATSEFQEMRKQAELDRAKMRIVHLKEAFVEKNPDLAWMLGDVLEVIAWNNFVVDICGKLRRYGELSDKQIDAVRTAYAKATARAACEVKTEPAPVVDVLEGRVEITGTILSVKEQDSPFGWVVKMLVLDDRGFKVWGSVPSSIGLAEKDQRVTFVATVAKSDKDSAFGFFSRPSKARRLDEVSA